MRRTSVFSAAILLGGLILATASVATPTGITLAGAGAALRADAFSFVPDEKKIVSKLEKALKGQNDHIERTVRRVGDQTIELETLIGTELDLDVSSKILSDFKNYQKWALRNINKHPDGGEYLLKLLGVPPEQSDPNVLVLYFRLDLPLFKSPGKQRFRMSADRSAGHLELRTEAITTPDSIMDWARGFARIYPVKGARNRVWCYAIGRMRLNSWLLYEAMPDRMLNNLVAHRVHTFVANVLEEQDRVTDPASAPARVLSAPAQRKADKTSKSQ